MFTTVGDSFDEDDFGDISRQDESLALPGPIYDRLKPYDEDVNHLKFYLNQKMVHATLTELRS